MRIFGAYALEQAKLVVKGDLVRLCLVFSFFFLTAGFVYLSLTVLSSNDDHFFHFRFAELMREQGLFTVFDHFTALYFSRVTEGEYYLYYNFFFYLAILPFTFVTPLYLGVKLYAVFAVATFFTVLYGAARYFRVPHAFLLVVALFSLLGTDSLWRLFLSRPYVLAPALLLLLFVSLHSRRYVVASGISFAYLFWHSATFFLPIAVAGAYALFDALHTKRIAWSGILSVGAGTGAAVVAVELVAPGFILYIKEIIFTNIFSLHSTSIPEGNELYPADIINYIRQNSILMALLILAIGLEIGTYLRLRRGDLSLTADPLAPTREALVFIGLVFLAGTALISGRFGDYLSVFFGLYLMLALVKMRDYVTIDPHLARVLSRAVVVAIVYVFITAAVTLQAFIAHNGAPAETFEGVGRWLSAHVKSGEVVFNPTWNWFPQLYYYNPQLNYITGLEPRFLFTYDERLYWLWTNISTRGFVCSRETCADLEAQAAFALTHPEDSGRWYREQGDAVAETLLTEFTSRYVVSSYEFVAMNALLDTSKRFKKVYGGNRTYYVYEVLP